MKILGVWDGHDSGAALVKGNRILFAVNEERLTRRKLEIMFPVNAIEACLSHSCTRKDELRHIAVSTSDVAKTLSRLFPRLKEEYYLIRRRKKGPGSSSHVKKKAKYKLTEFPPFFLSRWISRRQIIKELKNIGFSDFSLHLSDHHHCHAAAAAYGSGFDRGLAITLDGLGDGLSGTVYRFEEGMLNRVAALSARHSLGIFFEHVTNLMNMRELEDEGKVMALSNYAYPVDDGQNPMLRLIEVDGLDVRCRYSALKMYDELKRILWKFPSEQFAYMAQRTLEVKIVELVQNAVDRFDLHNICLAGGVFSNVKVNRLIRNMDAVDNCYVFPHMGDGGLALGAAWDANFSLNGVSACMMDDLFLGPEYSGKDMADCLESSGLTFEVCNDVIGKTAALIAEGNIVFWFQGRMEYGPRALGGRSILARPDSTQIKDLLNLRLKKRVWYQPFCPAMLEDDAARLLADYDGRPNKFMTMAYQVKEERRHLMAGVTNVDGSCRPQILPESDPSRFRDLLLQVKKLTGQGVLLNTSFNLHGEPLVCSPADAVATMKNTGCDYLVMGDYLVRQKDEDK